MDVDPIHEEEKAKRAAANAARKAKRDEIRGKKPSTRAHAHEGEGHEVGAEPPAGGGHKRSGERIRASERRNRGKKSANLPVPVAGWGGRGGPPADGEGVELPRYQPNDEDALSLAIMRANGYTPEACSRHFGLPIETLEAYYPRALAHGFEMISAQIGGKVVIGALAGDQKDQHFWLKARAGWGGAAQGNGPGTPGADKAYEPITMTTRVSQAQASSGLGHGIPAPGPNGKVKLSMVIGIVGDRMGDDDGAGDDYDGVAVVAGGDDFPPAE